MENPIEVSDQQVDIFLAVVKENARPVQALNKRTVFRKD